MQYRFLKDYHLFADKDSIMRAGNPCVTPQPHELFKRVAKVQKGETSRATHEVYNALNPVSSGLAV